METGDDPRGVRFGADNFLMTGARAALLVLLVQVLVRVLARALVRVSRDWNIGVVVVREHSPKERGAVHGRNGRRRRHRLDYPNSEHRCDRFEDEITSKLTIKKNHEPVGSSPSLLSIKLDARED